MLMTVLLVLHVLMAAALIALILIQRGRGAETGAAFGSGASATMFGARGSASFLSRTTAILAILFFSNCVVLWHLSNQQAPKKSLMESVVTSPASKIPTDTTSTVSKPADVPAKPGTENTAAPQSAAGAPSPESSPAPTQAAGAGTAAVPAPESKAADVPAAPPAPKN